MSETEKSLSTKNIDSAANNLEKLAKYQRLAIFSFLAILIIFLLMVLISPKVSILLFLVWVFQFYVLVGLARQIGWSPIAVIFGLFFPIVNIAILLIGSQKATNELKKVGVKVGLLGVSPKQLSEMHMKSNV